MAIMQITDTRYNSTHYQEVDARVNQLNQGHIVAFARRLYATETQIQNATVSGNRGTATVIEPDLTRLIDVLLHQEWPPEAL